MNTISALPNQTVEPKEPLGQSASIQPASDLQSRLQSEVQEPAESQAVSMDQLNNTVSELREFLGSQESMSFNIRIDDSLREPVIKIIDQDSGESVKQIPTEQALQISKAILEMRGLFVDESA